jgi:hypothetical protein
MKGTLDRSAGFCSWDTLEKLRRGAEMDAEIRDLAGDHAGILELGDADRHVEAFLDQIDEAVVGG